MNAEVSLPTGSLCAERCAISAAHANYPSMTLKQMRSIAVVDCSSAFENGTVENPLPPCGACSEWLTKIAEVSDNFRVLTFTDHLFDIVIERCLQNTIDESLDIPAEMTAWTCSWCETWNEPRTQFCKKCESHRNRDSNMIPALRWSKRYHRIIQLLMHHEEGMTINEISEARQWPINFLTLWIDHLVKAGALKKDTNNRYRAVPEALKKMKGYKGHDKKNDKKDDKNVNSQDKSQNNNHQAGNRGSQQANNHQGTEKVNNNHATNHSSANCVNNSPSTLHQGSGNSTASYAQNQAQHQALPHAQKQFQGQFHGQSEAKSASAKSSGSATTDNIEDRYVAATTPSVPHRNSKRFS